MRIAVNMLLATNGVEKRALCNKTGPMHPSFYTIFKGMRLKLDPSNAYWPPEASDEMHKMWK